MFCVSLVAYNKINLVIPIGMFDIFIYECKTELC